MPSPQTLSSRLHESLHPSQSVLLPSSQTSSSGQIVPSPQVDPEPPAVQSALQEIADQFTITTSQPGSPSEGDLFYDTDDNVLQVYADADGSRQWLTILRAGAADDMQRLDGGSF